ncbi:MAG TPA: Gfo/Idh/MocA family oxidoreductase [Acidimicrobiales bacterium]|nr:Gfo/Idh/MocA family oxidoreductase [Acidimicrobiales bacterium]
MNVRRRYALVGTGARSQMYTRALATTYRHRAQLVGLCDVNPVRLEHAARRFRDQSGDEGAPLVLGPPDQLAGMLQGEGVDEVIVTSIDRTHDRYVVAAMEAGCDVICEKPLTVDAERCSAILRAQQRTGHNLRVTFNYRYSPRNSALARLLMEGAIGTPTSVHFEWLLDTVHGADYFRRWHRDKRNSGGLMVHKASHHFDLVNWWLRSVPVKVFGLGDLRFYGRANAEERGVTHFYERGTGNAADPFALDLSADHELRALYLDAEGEDGYLRDLSVFSDGISIEDDMAVLARYSNKATMSYHLVAYAPWEGYRVMVNGTEGRLELDVEERSYVSGRSGETPGGNRCTLTLRRHWEKPEQLDVEGSDEGGHGGGDSRMLEDIFGEAGLDPLGRAAGALDGAWAVLTGIAANTSFATGVPVVPGDLVPEVRQAGG